MAKIKTLPEFDSWLATLKDSTIRGVIAARIRQLEHGNPGDVEPVGEGVSELRIHKGAGWRVYYVQHGDTIILWGGSKKTQDKDIKKAKKLAGMLE